MKRTLNFPALILFIGFSLFIFSNGVAHPFYVSVCQIDYNSDTNSLEITLKLFTDDLESVLAKNDAEELHLGSEKEAESADSLISAYIAEKLTIAVEGKQQSWEYLGKETDIEVTWCYLEISDVPAFRKLEIDSRIFLAKFETQQNIIHVNTGTEKKSLLLQRGESSGVLTFQ